MRLNEISYAQFRHKNAKNKWHWGWMEERDSEGQKYGEWLKKPDTMGMGKSSGKNVNYKSSGKKALRLHAEDASHKKSLRTVKSNKVRDFL